MEQHDIRKTLEEVSLFLSVIDENADNILQQLSLRTEQKPFCEDDIAFLSRLEEDAEEIKKALKVIKDHTDKIASISF
jgi:hypothetical protein